MELTAVKIQFIYQAFIIIHYSTGYWLKNFTVKMTHIWLNHFIFLNIIHLWIPSQYGLKDTHTKKIKPFKLIIPTFHTKHIHLNPHVHTYYVYRPTHCVVFIGEKLKKIMQRNACITFHCTHGRLWKGNQIKKTCQICFIQTSFKDNYNINKDFFKKSIGMIKKWW